MKKKYLSKQEALFKLQHYCAYQDRCHQEVRSKLLELGIYGNDLEEIMTDLVLENFLNEERFARSYVRGKFRIKKWGRVKINQSLEQKAVSKYCIQRGLEEIEEEDYLQTLTDLANKKLKSYGTNIFETRQKTGLYLIRKGYESTLVWQLMKQLAEKNIKF